VSLFLPVLPPRPGGPGAAGLALYITLPTIQMPFLPNSVLRRQRAFKLGDWFLHATRETGSEWLFLMLTFRDWDTYREGFGLNGNGKRRKGHLQEFLHRLQVDARRKCGREVPLLWVVELQGRGVPHYHLLMRMPRRLDGKPYRVGFPDRVRRNESNRGRKLLDAGGRWWSAGWTGVKVVGQQRCRVRRAGGSAGEAQVLGYLLKYMAKDLDGPELKGWRRLGASGLTPVERDNRRLATAPEFVRATAQGGKVRRSRATSAWQANPQGWGWVDCLSEFAAQPACMGGRAGLIVTPCGEGEVRMLRTVRRWQSLLDAEEKRAGILANCERLASGWAVLDRSSPAMVWDSERVRAGFLRAVASPTVCLQCRAAILTPVTSNGFKLAKPAGSVAPAVEACRRHA